MIPPEELVTWPCPNPVTCVVRVYPNCAIAVRLPIAVNWHVARDPVHGPCQSTSTAPASGVAVNVTVDPGSNTAEHFVPQLMPSGLLVTVPTPFAVADSNGIRTGPMLEPPK